MSLWSVKCVSNVPEVISACESSRKFVYMWSVISCIKWNQLFIISFCHKKVVERSSFNFIHPVNIKISNDNIVLEGNVVQYLNKWPTQKCERNFGWTVDCCYCYLWQGRYFYNCYLNAICIGIVREARCKRVSTINCSTTIGSCVKNLVIILKQMISLYDVHVIIIKGTEPRLWAVN